MSTFQPKWALKSFVLFPNFSRQVKCVQPCKYRSRLPNVHFLPQIRFTFWCLNRALLCATSLNRCNFFQVARFRKRHRICLLESPSITPPVADNCIYSTYLIPSANFKVCFLIPRILFRPFMFLTLENSFDTSEYSRTVRSGCRGSFFFSLF